MVLKEGTYAGVILRTFENVNLKATVTSHAAFKDVEAHQHQNPYLSILLKGSYCESDSGAESLLVPGNFIYRPAFYIHANEIKNEDCICCNIELKTPLFEHKPGMSLLPKERKIYRPGEFTSLDLALHYLANNILDYETLLLDWVNESNSTPARSEKKLVARVNDFVRDTINSNPAHNPNLTIIAESIFVHPVYLARAYKSATGITIGSFVRKCKIEKAFKLLVSTDMSIASIAYELGFFDTAHFIRTFNRFYNVSPHQFRISAKKLI